MASRAPRKTPMEKHLAKTRVKNSYLIHMEGGIDPNLHGPLEGDEFYATAKSIHADMEENDVLFALEIDGNGKPDVWAFAGGFFEEEEEETK